MDGLLVAYYISPALAPAERTTWIPQSFACPSVDRRFTAWVEADLCSWALGRLNASAHSAVCCPQPGIFIYELL